MNIKDKTIIGCFVSSNMGDVKGDVFRDFIWGDSGITKLLNKLDYRKYGSDLELILLQFYINPIPYLLNNLDDIENYRKKEKSIGIPIIITNSNFFSKEKNIAFEFLKNEILNKLILLELVVKKKKIDTNIELLQNDVKNILK